MNDRMEALRRKDRVVELEILESLRDAEWGLLAHVSSPSAGTGNAARKCRQKAIGALMADGLVESQRSRGHLNVYRITGHGLRVLRQAKAASIEEDTPNA